jgi:tRNA dimethylallyltransferase
MIAGPTASGKSALGLRLAQSLGGDIVGADSMQLYQDLGVLTARPTREEMLLAPHHLLGIADAADAWSVGRWLDAARAALEDIARWRRSAILVGGTGLYFRALTRGLAEIPSVPRAARQALENDLDRVGEPALRTRLARLDPEAEARIARGDRQRLLRALAVAEHTGRSLSDWRRDTRPLLAPGEWIGVVIEPPREALYTACDARLASMFESGAIEEARGLLARGLDPGLPAMKAVGVREIADYLEGRTGRSEALARAQQATRRYAKRQLTWFRNQTPDWPRIETLDPDVQWAALSDIAAAVGARPWGDRDRHHRNRPWTSATSKTARARCSSGAWRTASRPAWWRWLARATPARP